MFYKISCASCTGCACPNVSGVRLFCKRRGRSLCPLIRRVRAFIPLPGKLSAMLFNVACAPSCAVFAAVPIGSGGCRVFFCAVRQRDCRAGSPRVPLPRLQSAVISLPAFWFQLIRSKISLCVNRRKTAGARRSWFRGFLPCLCKQTKKGLPLWGSPSDPSPLYSACK